ncbi:Starch-binding associating with outer membrane [Lutibacter agarilyticus]|uniref:Starch-binding associating with outer membrane n=1 Tax=Lutibacter agarilyticus TaxID=1109740 RepID=A0A238X6G8_9FLAO|nr:RagB/SusD family nutrient uptake outer membrane protein [Lutibacter agarilyticus]SNR54232.1 Starch-binding associating with outer membrane [Lutibacter agarilyticus]
MINIKNYLLILVTLIFFASCQDFLEEEPASQLSPENYYKTANQAESAVVGAYNALQRNGVFGPLQYFMTTDLVRTASWNTAGGIGTYTFSADNVQVVLPLWKDHFQGINEVNAAITHVPNVDMDVDRRNELVAEARFLRALMYFNLVRYFGDVPYFETETNSLENLEVPRDPASMVYEKIIADLEFAIDHLDTKAEITQVGRATAGAAKTALAKVYLTRGSMMERDGNGDSSADFQMAATLSREVISSSEYTLLPYYPDIFIIENQNNDEIIFDVQYKSGGIDEGSWIGAQMGLQGNPQLGGSWGNIHATTYFHTMYEDTDMVRQEWTTPHVTVLGNGTLRLDLPWWQVWKIGKFRRYPVRKSDYQFRDADTNWPVFRYAEVLLIYAEALNEVNNGPNAEVFDALNQLRARARNVNGDGTRDFLHADILPRNLTYDSSILPDISSTDYPDYASMKEYIMFERARELGGEAKRWFDLTRWGNLVDRIQAPLNISPAEGGGWNITANNVGEHHNLLPIPNTEMQSNPNLVQNPGY